MDGGVGGSEGGGVGGCADGCVVSVGGCVAITNAWTGGGDDERVRWRDCSGAGECLYFGRMGGMIDVEIVKHRYH